MGEVASAVGAIRSQIVVLQEACDGLSPRELVGLLTELTSVMRMVPALEHRVLNRLTAQTEPARLGEASWKKVLTTALRVSGADAGQRLRLAKNLGPRQAMTGEVLAPVWEATAAAQAAGLIGAEHVAVIEKFHKALPGWVDVHTRGVAEKQLAALAAGLGPEQLTQAAIRLIAMIDQDGPAPSEQDRARKRAFHVGVQQADGMSRISGWLTPQARAVFDAVAAKYAAPGMCNPDDESPCVDGDPGQRKHSDTRTQGQRTHDAFLAMGRMALCSGELGSHNGLPVTVIATATVQDLETAAGVAVTGGGTLLPMADLIRMAAHAHHYLYLYDKHTSESLYLGRTKRLASPAQRIVLHARDRGCTRPGCTVPGYWCQAHHAVADWKDGGLTNVDDMALGCGPDNRMIENTDWRTRKNRKGKAEWLPPPELDTGQHRINGYHHPERYLLPDDDDPPEDDKDP